MTTETALADIATSVTTLGQAVALQQTGVNTAVAAIAQTTARVNALNLVENTSDIGKPVSTATTAALATKQAVLVSGTNISTVNGQSLLSGSPLVIARGATSLNTVAYDDRATLRAASPALDDSSVVEGLGLFQWVGTKLEADDDETCFSTTSGQWILKLPAWDLIDAWNLFEQSITDDWREDEPKRFAAYLLANK